MISQNKLAGGFYGLLIGDALGVPYEFHRAEEIPPYQNIEMVPPHGFSKSYQVDAGTWSDDGAQALCLLDSLLTCGSFSLHDFSNRLLAWYEQGLWAVNNVVFDVGFQTGLSLSAYKTGLSPEKCGLLKPDGKGNGALMRTLPLALYHSGTDKELVLDAHKQCLITHGHPCNQVCCALYCLIARFLLYGMDFPSALSKATYTLREIYQDMPEYEQELEWSIQPDLPFIGSGTGYVIDCLRSTFMILGDAANYEDAVKHAIMLGNDTDTTACVTGGLAGILFGFSSIPKRWFDSLKDREKADNLFSKLQSIHLT